MTATLTKDVMSGEGASQAPFVAAVLLDGNRLKFLGVNEITRERTAAAIHSGGNNLMPRGDHRQLSFVEAAPSGPRPNPREERLLAHMPLRHVRSQSLLDQLLFAGRCHVAPRRDGVPRDRVGPSCRPPRPSRLAMIMKNGRAHRDPRDPVAVHPRVAAACSLIPRGPDRDASECVRFGDAVDSQRINR